MHDYSSFLSVIASSSDQIILQGKSTSRLRISLTFTNASVLHIRENTVIEGGWIDYAYQRQTASHQLIIRWDNAHPVNLPTSPHHQHIGSEENIQPSEPMTLQKVLAHIAATLLVE